MKQGSRLLLDEYPLMVLPQLAKKIGLNEAIVLQQIHYWLMQSGKERDGRTWIFNTLEEWKKQFPFWGLSTIHRTIKKLEKCGLVLTGNYNKLKLDQTKWYTIDYNALNTRFVLIEQMGNAKNVDNFYKQNENQNDKTICAERQAHLVNLNRPIPETTPETSTKIIKDKAFLRGKNVMSFVDNLSSDAREVYDYFIQSYIENRREGHPPVNEDVVDKLNDLLQTGYLHDPDMDTDLYIGKDDFEVIIDRYFKTNYPLTDGGYADHRIWHFLSDGVLKNLYYKELF